MEYAERRPLSQDGQWNDERPSSGKCPDWFYETMDAAKLQRLQSEHMAIWDQFKLHAEARGAWHMALRMMVTEHRSFAETTVFIGYRLPED